MFYISVNTLLIAKPEKARAVEGLLINMAQRGQLPGRLGEKELISILEQVSGSSSQSKTTVKVSYGYSLII
jgi:programmed cell death protein 5